VVSFTVILICYFALKYQYEGYLLFVVTIASMLWFIKICIASNKEVRKKLLLLIPFAIFGILFWVFDEQIFTSVEIFIERNIHSHVLGYKFPASMIVSVNNAAVIVGGLFFAWVWKVYKRLDGDFGRMMKFLFGFVLQLLCFVMLILAAKEASIYGKTSIVWVIFAIFMLGLSELFIDPIALSEITSIDSNHNTSFLAAIYMLFTGSIAGFIGARVANMASFKNVSEHADLVTQANLFQGLFTYIALVIVGMIVLWFIIALFVKKLK
jgi:POT family proton-dependent oligopeptide transporter